MVQKDLHSSQPQVLVCFSSKRRYSILNSRALEALNTFPADCGNDEKVCNNSTFSLTDFKCFWWGSPGKRWDSRIWQNEVCTTRQTFPACLRNSLLGELPSTKKFSRAEGRFFFLLYRNRQYLKRFHFLPKIKNQRTAIVNFVGKDSKRISQKLYR